MTKHYIFYRVLIRVAACTLFASFCWLWAETPQVDGRLITHGAAGPFRIGMKVDELKTFANQEQTNLVDLNSEGLFSPAIVIANGQLKRSLLGEITINENHEWILWRILVYDPSYHTSTGIHVGSSYGALKKNHPSIKIFDEE
jgi:hypothetical protein